MLKESKNFVWGLECWKAFDEVKEYLTKAPLLIKLDPKIFLQLYLAVSDIILGVVLVKEHKGNQHHVFFYISNMLKDAEMRYPNAEKFAYGLFMATQNCDITFKEESYRE